METLSTIGIIVGLLCSFGMFLDKHHFEESTIEKIRLRLIEFFILLDDLPDQVRDRSAPLIQWFDKLHEKGEFNLQTGKPVEVRRDWTFWVQSARIFFALGIALIEYNNSGNLWFSVVEGALVAYIAPLILLVGIGAWVSLVIAMLYLFVIVIRIIRRFLLLVLNKSTSPKTTPFTYMAALISIFIATGEGAHQISKKFKLEFPAVTWFDDDPITVGPNLGGGDDFPRCDDEGERPRRKC